MNELGQFASNVASWRQLMASMPDDSSRWSMFANAAQDFAGYVAKGLGRVAAVDELYQIATAHGLADTDQVQQIISDAFHDIEQPPYWTREEREQPKPKPNGKHDGKQPANKLVILSKADFIKGFVAPDYLIDGLLQRRFIYALTGQTGHAKTAVALLIAQLVSSVDKNAMLGTHRVDKGRVIYFVGENPDDVRMRVIGGDAKRGEENTGADNISFIAGIFNIAEMFGALEADMRRNGEAAMIIIDTSAAYFFGNEELSNTQMGAYARILRSLTTLPGGPCVLVLCHPIKHVTEPSQLLPRGGGAYLAEMDGNLTLWRLSDELIELHHGKIRGPGFQAMTFKLESILTEKLRDKKGRLISTVRAVAISQREEEQRITQAEDDEDRVLAAMLAKPADVGGSFAVWAQDIGWVNADGEAYKKKVDRIVKKLSGKKPKLTYENRSKWGLTDEGKTVARKAALRLEADRQTAGQGTLI